MDFTATLRISRRVTFLPLVATSLEQKTQSRDPASLPVVVRMEKSNAGRGLLRNHMLWEKKTVLYQHEQITTDPVIPL